MYSCSCCCYCYCCSVTILRLFQTLITPSILHQILTSRPFLESAGSCASNETNIFWKICLKGVQKWIFPSLLKCKNQEIWMVHTEVTTPPTSTFWSRCNPCPWVFNLYSTDVTCPVETSQHTGSSCQPVSRRPEAPAYQGPSGPW